MVREMLHLAWCVPYRHWRRWRYNQPFWWDDNVAHMLGIAIFGCPWCGRGATEQKKAWDRLWGR